MTNETNIFNEENEESKGIKLSREVVIQLALERIPFVGSSMSTIYSSQKNEKRFKRLERFYQELYVEIGEIEKEIKPIKDHDEDSFFAIIEIINEKIEFEHSEEKIKFLRTFFRNTLISPIIKTNYDERKFFLESLYFMTLLECEILIKLSGNDDLIEVNKIELSGVDEYAIIGAIGRLKSYGYIRSTQPGMVLGVEVEYPKNESVGVTGFGRSFIKFCLD